ncbi:MAG TPA: phospholipase D-like domain-containing protein [Candidatus Tumulicola sp.]|nr:phospholipase D-like domain-containing protein [Candidatus Tumulicola sp.]
MGYLHVALGGAARDAFCSAFDGAKRSIDAEFFSIRDPSLVQGLNRAAARGVDVTVHVEGDPDRYGHRGAHEPKPRCVLRTTKLYSNLFDPRVHVIVESDAKVLEHSKAVVIDDARALLATANANDDGFRCPGEVCVEDDAAVDVAAVKDAIAGRPGNSSRIVAGPSEHSRDRIARLLGCAHDLRIASEDLSDPQIVNELAARRAAGLHDEVLVKREGRETWPEKRALSELSAAGVSVRSLGETFMHDKYIDTGDEIYVGSANLTRNGLDEAREIGIIAPSADFGEGAVTLRADFDRMWPLAQPV